MKITFERKLEDKEKEKEKILLEKIHSDEKLQLIKEIGIKANNHQINSNNNNSNNINNNFHINLLPPPFTTDIGKAIFQKIVETKAITSKTSLDEIAEWIAEELQYYTFVSNIKNDILVFKDSKLNMVRDKKGEKINKILFDNEISKEFMENIVSVSKEEWQENMTSYAATSDVVQKSSADLTKKKSAKQNTMLVQRIINQKLPSRQDCIKFRFQTLYELVKNDCENDISILLNIPLLIKNIIKHYKIQQNNQTIEFYDIIYIVKNIFKELLPEINESLSICIQKVIQYIIQNHTQTFDIINKVNNTIEWYLEDIKLEDEYIQDILKQIK
jgi:hypothetical protein